MFCCFGLNFAVEVVHEFLPFFQQSSHHSPRHWLGTRLDGSCEWREELAEHLNSGFEAAGDPPHRQLPPLLLQGEGGPASDRRSVEGNHDVRE